MRNRSTPRADVQPRQMAGPWDQKWVRVHQGAGRVPNTDSVDRWVAIACRAVAKMAAGETDADDFSAMSAFIGARLAAGDADALVDLESRLRSSDRDALTWYFWLARTHAGTVHLEGSVHHLILTPVVVSAPMRSCLSLGPTAQQIGSLLEYALDLGIGSVQLFDHAVPVSTLESLSLSQWRAVATGNRDTELGLQPLPLRPAGALVGRWTVPDQDKPRLLRKLSHALQPSTAVENWKKHTETVLAARAGVDRVNVLPTMLLQDAFGILRRFILLTAIEAVRPAGATRLRWSWCDSSSELSWSVCGEHAESVQTGNVRFPDEPWAAIAGQLRYAARRFSLSLDPPLC
jgi:hypothetical protein